MTTSITSAAGTLYTWDGGAFNWESAEAGKTWLDAAATAFTAIENDGFSLVPLYQKLPLALSTEGLSSNDAVRSLAVSARYEPLSLFETYIDLISFILKVVESFSVSENLSQGITPKTHVDFLGIRESQNNTLFKLITHFLAANEQITKTATKPVNENMACTENYTKSFAVNKQSIFGATDQIATRNLVQKSDTLALSETYTDLISFISQISEHLFIAYKNDHQSIQTLNDHMAFIVRILRASNAVLSDLAFKSTPLDLASFEQLVLDARPLGFGAFKDLTPGDYEYGRAIIKLVLEAPLTNANRVALSDVKLNIDVPDIRDRGSLFVPVSGVFVTFNRSFNAPPEVQATFKGGSIIAIPRIGSISTTGFEISLVRPDTQSLVAGNASWSAEGY